MTCIVGLINDGKVFIGGDSAGVHGLHVRTRADRKIFKNGRFVFGFTSSFRMGQILQFSFVPPKHHADTDVFKFMVTDFVNAVRKVLQSGGYALKDKERESGGTFLVGYESRLFTVCDDYQVAEVSLPYAACGCGEQYAIGALFATSKITPRRRIKIALEAAEENSGGVRGPFHIEST